MNAVRLLDQFRGCMVGALIGDSLGSHFEFTPVVNYKALAVHIDRAERNEGTNIELTDDTQMTQELADSLIAHESFNAEDLARRFTDRYYNDGERAGYGCNVIDVFAKLRKSQFVDPFGPASEQFGGRGSYGNGAAMRVAPVPLFAYPDLMNTVKLAEQTSFITHTNILGVHGALLEALAIRRALLAAPVTDALKYVADLRDDLKAANVCNEYLVALDTIEAFLKKGKVVNTEVMVKLGNGVQAHKSVATAVYCFLRALEPIPEIPGSCPFRRAIEYAISLEGDTDTIASMAGAIAGANVGLSSINKNIVESCADSDRAIRQADALYAIASKNTNETKL